jgi:hypothetical protein
MADNGNGAVLHALDLKDLRGEGLRSKRFIHRSSIYEHLYHATKITVNDKPEENCRAHKNEPMSGQLSERKCSAWSKSGACSTRVLPSPRSFAPPQHGRLRSPLHWIVCRALGDNCLPRPWTTRWPAAIRLRTRWFTPSVRAGRPARCPAWPAPVLPFGCVQCLQ